VTNAPFLTIVLTGRNDDYGGDFTTRFLRALTFNHERLTERRIEYQIAFVEWSPIPQRRLLADILADNLPREASARLFSFIVDARYQAALTLNPRIRYLEFVAKNVGIRQAGGQFVLSTNTDVYLGREILDRLASADLAPATVYRAQRIDLRMAVDQTHVDWTLLEDGRNYVKRVKPLRPPLCAGATGDFILLDRASLHRLGGFNEVYRVARFAIDLNFLVKAYSNGYDIADIGGPVYHVNHVDSFRATRRHAAGREAKWGRPSRARRVIYENPGTWGLANAPIRQTGARTFHLDFAWTAVPPIVDLRGVRLPVARVGRESA
jgi:hypothetical protein